jgi:hypothetical protein
MSKYKCEICNKICRDSFDLKRHLNKKNKCSNNISNNSISINELLLKLIEENKEMKENIKKLNEKTTVNNIDTINNTVNNTTNNTTNNVINVVAFGKEDLSIFTDEQCTAFLKRGFNSVNEFVKSLHFDINKPQYNSIYISNLNDGKYACVYDGTKWIKCLRETAIEDLKDKGIDFLNAKYNELIKNGKLTEQHKKSLQTFIDFTEDRDGFNEQQKLNNTNEKKMNQNLELLLYNEGQITKNARKLMKYK